MDIDKLRLKHKQLLVDYALSAFCASKQHCQQTKDRWVASLLDGYDFQQFIQDIKIFDRVISDDTAQHVGIDSDATLGYIQVVDANLELHTGLKRKLKVRIFNNQDSPLKTTPEEPFFVCYHWYKENGEVYEFDGVRTPIDTAVLPSNSAEMWMKLTPPDEPGHYRLMVTLVIEGKCWLENEGLGVQLLDLTVHEYHGGNLTRHAQSVFNRIEAIEFKEINSCAS